MRSTKIGAALIVIGTLCGCSEAADRRSRDASQDGSGRDAGHPPPGGNCTPTNCDGCCAGMVCVRGFSQAQCGQNGETCSPCEAPLSCIGGKCKAGVIEICNNMDDDEDGAMDEGCDDDGDQYCDAAMTTKGTPIVCRQGGLDCNDALELVHPGATEICNDRDDNCDGKKDEGSVCEGQDPVVALRPAHLPAVMGQASCVGIAAKLFCMGGMRAPAQMNEIVSFDPTSNVVVTMQATLSTPRLGLSCVASTSSGDGVTCFGGFWEELRCERYEAQGCVSVRGYRYYFDEIQHYDPTTDRRSVKQAKLPAGATELACAEDSSTHKIYCLGGIGNGLTALDAIVAYDPAGDTLSVRKAKLPTARGGLSCAENSLTHRIYCFGGHVIDFERPTIGAGAVDSIVAYDPATDQMTELSVRLPAPRTHLSCVEKSDTHKIYCAGGYGAQETPQGVQDRYFDEIVELDPSGPTVTVLSSTFASPRHAQSCAEHRPSHSLFCFGGGTNVINLDEIVQIQP